MNSCEEIQDLFVEALYDELKREARQTFEAHLKECSKCASEFAAMRSTLEIMDGRQRPDPGEAFWQQFDAKLQKNVQAPIPVEAPAIISFRHRVPSWVWQAAAAVLLIGLGVVIGRLNIRSEEHRIAVQPRQMTAPVQMASTDVETRRFLERSEVLLLGVVNTDADETDSYEGHLAHQKEVSRDLIQEASLIKGKLNDPGKRRLRELVSDLQVILLQIANLEAEKDQPEIEILKSGVDRKGLLLKINLEQMRLSSPEASKPEPSQTQKGPAI